MFEVFCELCTPSFPLNIPFDILSEDVLNFCLEFLRNISYTVLCRSVNFCIIYQNASKKTRLIEQNTAQYNCCVFNENKLRRQSYSVTSLFVPPCGNKPLIGFQSSVFP